MASTYTTNLGIEKIATGEQSGTWGSTTNTNLDLIDQAVNGIVQITVAATGSTGSPNALTITNGSASDGRNKFIDFYSPTDLGGTVYYQLDPNDAEKIAFVRNSLGGGQTLVLFQGTYNASNDVEVPNGVDMLVKFDGTGASATVTNVFEKLQVNALSVNDGNITNVGDIALDSISADGTQIDIDITDNTASAFTISEGANNYIEITTTDGSELITVSKNSTFAGTTIADLGVVTTVDINGGTIDGVTIGGASAGAGTFTTLNTTGAVVFNEAGADVDFRVEGDTDANLLFVDASTDNVGIGTSSPKSDDGGNKLEISNNANTVVTLTATNDTTPLLNFRSNAVDRLSIQSSSNFGANFLVRSNQDMRFGTNNTERLRIDSSGNVGIGTTSPDASMGPGLHIKSVSGNSLILEKDTGAAIQFRSDASTIRATIGGINGADGLTIATGAAQTERLRITSAGNVGLGNTPSATSASGYTAFELGANAGTGLTGNNGDLYINENAYVSGGAWKYAASSIASAQYNLSSGAHKWFIAAAGTANNNITWTQAMTLDATGNLLVGSTTSSLTSGDGFVFTPDANVAGAKTGYATDTQTCWNMYSSGAAAYRFYVGWGGTVFATNTTISAISDQRLKENIQDLDAGLDKIMALKPRQFDWKEGKGKNVKGDRGFIAQEFEQVFPDLIDEWKDPAPEGEDPYKSVRADLIPVLVKAIQELKAENDALKSRLDTAGL
jgi:hypothetical protein